jgi:nitric oxide reductase large subunit
VLFSTVHLPFIDPDYMAKYKAAPGEVYWYRQKRYRCEGHDIWMHYFRSAEHVSRWYGCPSRWRPAGRITRTSSIHPCPSTCKCAKTMKRLSTSSKIRQPKWITCHRYTGYLIVALLTFAGIPGAATIVNHSFGGTLDTQLSGAVFGSAVYTALALGLYNIWKLQLDQHRKWMLRAMVWMSLIVTSRICLMILIVSLPKGAYQTVRQITSRTLFETKAQGYRYGHATKLVSPSGIPPYST